MRGIGRCAVLIAVLAAAPALADEPLAGSTRLAASHGQPFCADKAKLESLVGALVAHAPIAYGAYQGCLFIDDNTPVTVLEDLSPATRVMHVVKASAAIPLFGPIVGYTFTAGLSRY